MPAKKKTKRSPPKASTKRAQPAAKKRGKTSPATSRKRPKSKKKSPTPRVPRRVLEVLTHAGAVQSRMMAARGQHATVGFVPTMGALHAGHAALLDEARRRADIVVASIFVNPKQFAPHEDLSRYPRTFEADRALCDACGVDIIFAPGVEDMYPVGFDTAVRGGARAGILEGASRPGHFDGVLTVVMALFHMVQPHFAVFGEKDYQQLSLIRQMVRDLRVPTEIVPMPVIRDVDGLALSSRNRFLSAEDRQRATALYRALMAAQDEAQRGVVEPERFVRAARAVLDQADGVEVDYVEVRDPRTLEPIDALVREARLLIAARVGGVRLIDNGPLFAGLRF